ncbi:MAG: YheU family protein [Gammaproteobacteria bacterium]|nr:YheU family protein [Gammaproteobacteria bacterium]
MKVSHKLLSTDALQALLDEFITRDSVVWDGTLAQKRKRLLDALENERAFIVFDEDSSSTHILTAEEFASNQAQSDER